MGKVKAEKKNLRNKFDQIRQSDQMALGLVRPSNKRPLTAADCDSVPDCEKFRTDIVKEIIGRVERISDPTLDEYKVRDLNDLINKRFREKRMWEHRIKELGGPDYSKYSKNEMDLGGATVPGTKGYRYFGRAKYLDGVKELFEQAATIQEKIKPHELMHRVDADYFGYRDEEDGLLLHYEKKLEQKNCKLILEECEEIENAEFMKREYIPMEKVPTQNKYEEFMLVRRKKELEERFLVNQEA